MLVMFFFFFFFFLTSRSKGRQERPREGSELEERSKDDDGSREVPADTQGPEKT